MTKPPVPLTPLSENQQAQAQSSFTIIRPALEDGVTQTRVARTHNIPPSRVQRWVKRYREHEKISSLGKAEQVYRRVSKPFVSCDSLAQCYVSFLTINIKLGVNADHKRNKAINDQCVSSAQQEA
jgi:Helix-turn-helix domain